MKPPAKKILFVCLGNICRSPMAEALLKHKVDTSKFHIDSAGLDSWHLGEPPCELTRNILAEHGIRSDHRARLFSVRDFDHFDLIYVMDHQNLQQVLSMAGNDNHRQKVDLILNEIYPGENLDVPDPYMQNQSAIRQVYDLLDAATDKIAEKLNHENQS